MKTFTSALANKVIKKLSEDKQALITKENSSSVYKCFQNEKPVIPSYNYKETRRKIADIDAEILAIKHALNMFNCTTIVEEEGLTIDQVLIKMAQLEQEKKRLAILKDRQEIQRVDSFRNTTGVSEYQYANYKVEEAAEAYDKVAEEITRLQIALDTVNQTVTFTVDI